MQERPDEQLRGLALQVRRVGRWLRAIEAVQALAWVLVPVSGVIVACWVLGSCVRLAPAARVAAAAMWVAGSLLGIVWLICGTRRPISYAAVADFVEGRCGLDRRLVTAMEYYEAGRAYPYSTGLADQVVADVAQATRDIRLDALVDKWRLWSLCGLAGLALGLGGTFSWLTLQPLFSGPGQTPQAQTSACPNEVGSPAVPEVPEEPNLSPPTIERIWAQVTAPDPNRAGAEAQAFRQEVVDGNLAVPLGSRVDLTLEADRALAQAEVTLPDGTTRTLELDGSTRMTLGLQADRPGRVRIRVTDPNGLAAQTAVRIQTRGPSGHAPQFRLLSPDGDCQVAEDAHVTIAFQVLDEGGLGRARLLYRQPDQEATVLDMPLESGAKSVTFSHTLDIQALGLRAGDCILFHACADEAPTLPQGQSKTFNSPVYMIEVRAKTDPQEPEPAGPPGVKVDTLLDVLEYTRALIKNTWAAIQAQGPAGTPPDLKGLVHDVGCCHKALSRIRDDPNAGLSDEQKAAITPILSDYDQAGQALDRRDPIGALPAEERAYQALRLLVQEGPPQEPGQSVPDPNAADRPERVRIQDPNQQEQPGRQAPQQQGQDMGTLGDQLAALAQQQGRLKDQLSRLMQSQRDRAQGDQETADQASSDSSQQPMAEGGGRSGQPGSQGKGAGQGQERSSGDARTQTAGASASDRLAMLKAKQLALQQQAEALSASEPGADAGSKPGGASPDQGKPGPSTDAAPGVDSSVSEAIARMDQALRALGQMQSHGATGPTEGQQAAQSMDQAQQALARAGAAAEDVSERQAQAARLARDLMDKAQSLEKASLARQAQGLARQLTDAEALLKALGQPSAATVGGGSQASAPNLATVLTRSPNVAPTEMARRMAEQLQTASLGPGRRPGRVTPREPTDLGFFESENAFYEAVAQPRTGEP